MAERSIVDIGRFLQSKGLRIGEHPAFGGVGGGHAKGSFHYQPGGQAIDITDWRPDVAPAFAGGKPIPWKQRTGELSYRLKQSGLFPEVLGPGDKGHDTHVHLALPGKKFITDPQLEWIATGRYKDPTTGKLTDINPFGNQQNLLPQQNTGVSESKQLQEQQQPQFSNQPVNIVIDLVEDGGKKQITPDQMLQNYIVERFNTPRRGTMAPMQMAQQLLNTAPVNYFA
jgi:hypothetical protein